MFSVGRRDGYVTLSYDGHLLAARFHLDARPEDIRSAFHLAADLGWLRPGNQILIDIRDFIGSVDWAMVRDLRQLAPWVDGEEGGACAYLVRNVQLSWLVNIVTAFYPGVRHRTFHQEAQALAWLQDQQTSSPPPSV